MPVSLSSGRRSGSTPRFTHWRGSARSRRGLHWPWPRSKSRRRFPSSCSCSAANIGRHGSPSPPCWHCFASVSILPAGSPVWWPGNSRTSGRRVRSEKSTTTPSPGLTTTTCWVWSTGSTAWACETTASSRSCNWSSCLSLVLGCSGNSWFGSVRLMSCGLRFCSASFLACFSIIEATTRSFWPCRFSTVWTGPEIKAIAGRSCTRRLRPGWCWCSTFLGEGCSSDCQTGPRAADWRADWYRFWFFLTAPGSCWLPCSCSGISGVSPAGSRCLTTRPEGRFRSRLSTAMDESCLAVGLRDVLRKLPGRELASDLRESGQPLDRRHAHPILADQGLGIVQELIGHVDPAGADPALREEPLRVRDLLQRYFFVVRAVGRSAMIAQNRGHPAVAILPRDVDGVAADAVGFFQVDHAGVGDGVALICAGNLAARLARHRKLERVQVVDDHLGDRLPARAELHVTEIVANRPQFTHVEPLADDHDAPAICLELAEHVFAELLKGQSRLGQVDLKWHSALGVGQTCRGRDKANLAAHGLDDKNGVGRR